MPVGNLRKNGVDHPNKGIPKSKLAKLKVQDFRAPPSVETLPEMKHIKMDPCQIFNVLRWRLRPRKCTNPRDRDGWGPGDYVPFRFQMSHWQCLMVTMSHYCLAIWRHKVNLTNGAAVMSRWQFLWTGHCLFHVKIHPDLWNPKKPRVWKGANFVYVVLTYGL